MQRVPAQLLDLASESMISTRPDGEITCWNMAASVLYGWQPHEALGRNVADLMGPYPEEARQAVLAFGFWEGRLDRRRRDDSLCRVRIKLACSGESASPEWMEASSVLDAEHPAERALAITEYRYRNLFGAVAASFWELDFTGVGNVLRALAGKGISDIPAYLRAHPEISRELMRATRIIDTNDRSTEMFGPATKRELIATPLDFYWPEESTAAFTESVISAISNMPRHVAETRMRAIDGRMLDVLFTVSFLPGSVGSGTLLVGFTDISDRALAARQLGEVKTRRQMVMDVPSIALCELASPEVAKVFQQLRSQGVSDLRQHLDRHPDLIDFVIAHLRLTAVNEAAVRLFGANSAEELIGRSMEGILPSGSAIIRRSIEGAFLREPVYQAEMRISRLDGSPVDTLFCRVSNPDPSISDVLVALIDITEQVKVRDEAERMRQNVAHAARISLLGQLTASIVHEVSQPVTAILNHAAAAERLTRQAETPTQKLAGILALIGQHAGRVGEIIRRLREVAANREVPMVRLDLADVVSETSLLLHQELNENNVRLAFETAAQDLSVRGNRVQLQQILANLMMNGIQAMEALSPDDRRMEVDLRAEGPWVHVEISDCGVGLSEDILATPFQNFRTSKPNGLGMGLTISRSIAEAHGGSIEVRNRIDAPGVTAILTLPVFD